MINSTMGMLYSSCRERYIHVLDPNAVDENHTYLASQFDTGQKDIVEWVDTDNHSDPWNIFNFKKNTTPSTAALPRRLDIPSGVYMEMMNGWFEVENNRVLGMNAGTKEMYLRCRFYIANIMDANQTVFEGVDSDGTQIKIEWIFRRLKQGTEYGNQGMCRVTWVNHLGVTYTLESQPDDRIFEAGTAWTVKLFFYQNSVEFEGHKSSGNLELPAVLKIAKDCGQLRKVKAGAIHRFGTNIGTDISRGRGASCFGRVGFGSAISSRPPTPNP